MIFKKLLEKYFGYVRYTEYEDCIDDFQYTLNLTGCNNPVYNTSAIGMTVPTYGPIVSNGVPLSATSGTSGNYSIWGGGGSSSQTITIGGGAGGLGWAYPTQTYATLDVNGTLNLQGDAEFGGDIKIKGKSLSERLNKIEERLAILHPNSELESKWDELKALGTQYRELEKDIIEKEKIWDTLKK